VALALLWQCKRGPSARSDDWVSSQSAKATRADGSDARLHARAGGLIGEVYGAMRDVFGEYCGGAFF
jgi:hypothetical protein